MNSIAASPLRRMAAIKNAWTNQQSAKLLRITHPSPAISDAYFQITVAY